ncbi:Na+/alanine symporter [Fusobacterium necrophorum subsp. necrophorum]|nr:Na+/alanine symporter [Fusobacterium necrophorum subsp. necrophorum]
MWLVALLGASTSFIESCLAVMYREKLEDGKYIGGSPWILKKQMNCKWLGVIYAIASIICYLGVVQVMSNSITESVTSVYSHVDFGLTPIFQPLAAVFGVELDQENFLKYFLAVLISIITASVIFGKSKKDAIIEALNRIVPIMAVLYILLVIFILLTNITAIPAMIQIFFIKPLEENNF